MKPRYIIIDQAKRDRFERRWQLPYGYSGCRIFSNLDEAIKYYKEISKMPIGKADYIIESYENGVKEVIPI